MGSIELFTLCEFMNYPCLFCLRVSSSEQERKKKPWYNSPIEDTWRTIDLSIEKLSNRKIFIQADSMQTSRKSIEIVNSCFFFNFKIVPANIRISSSHFQFPPIKIKTET